MLVVHMQECYTLGGSGGMLPHKNFLNLGAMRLLLRPFLDQYDASRRPDDRVSHECHSAHCVILCWCHVYPIQFAYRPKATPFAGEVCKTNCSLVRTGKVVGRHVEQFYCTVRVPSYQYSTWYLCASGLCVGVRRTMVLISNARPSHKRGKKWSG